LVWVSLLHTPEFPPLNALSLAFDASILAIPFLKHHLATVCGTAVVLSHENTV